MKELATVLSPLVIMVLTALGVNIDEEFRAGLPQYIEGVFILSGTIGSAVYGFYKKYAKTTPSTSDSPQ
jgi:hypothetical protein